MPKYTIELEPTHRRKLKKPIDKSSSHEMNDWRKNKYAEVMCLYFKNEDKRDTFVAQKLNKVKEDSRSYYAKAQFIRRALYLLFKNGSVTLEEIKSPNCD